MTKSRIALLGLGIMGSRMAHRLLGAGFPVTVYNRNPGKAAPLAAKGASVAATPREAALNAQVIIGMVSDDLASRGLWLGAQGALAGIARGAVCIESSTLSVGWIDELARAVAAAGGGFLDCPVTGSKVQAENGELKFLVGGDATTLEKVRPVLAAMSQDIIHLGPAGSGALLKLINNALNGVQIAAFAEALVLIEQSGINRAKAVELITGGAPGSPIVKTVAARMMARDYTPHFLLSLITKDLRYAVEESERRQHSLTLAGTALGLFHRAVAAGHGNEDMAAVVELTRQNGAKP